MALCMYLIPHHRATLLNSKRGHNTVAPTATATTTTTTTTTITTNVP